MNGKLGKKDYLLIVIIVSFVLFFMFGFLLGGTVMKSRVSAHYQGIIDEMNAENIRGVATYPETDFTQFYHGVLSPYLIFEKEYIQFRSHLQVSSTDIDLLAEASELKKLAQKTHEEMNGITFDDQSPLLQEAQKQYLIAMESYEEALSTSFKGKLQDVKKRFTSLESKQQAETASLRGQTLFYEAIMTWETLQRPFLAQLTQQDWSNANFTTWKTWSVNQKNYAIAAILENKGLLSSYQPEDLTYHLDHYIRSATEQELTQYQLIDLILMYHKADAIVPGQFKAQRSTYYADEILPLIPIFWK